MLRGMTCSNCGTENIAGRRFCDNCGSPLAVGCPNCGESNRPEARFCGNCGTTLAGAAVVGTLAAGEAVSAARVAQVASAAERRLVSVLFADLVGFTPFAEERDPEQVRDILQRYFDAARTVIERHGGRVEKFIGDAVMAVWGTPVAREDDAERAVRAALELLPQVKTVDERLQARAAVLSGEAAVRVGAADQAMVAGDLVNTAARLQAVAPPDSVLVGESTMRAANAAIIFEAAGETVLKGKAAPVPAWRALRVVAERGGRARSDTIEPPFVGRAAELALLKSLLHATESERRSRLVAVIGPGGIGKSRLAWELEKYVDGLVDTIYWHRGRSPSYGEGVSFWALGEMVRRRCGLAETDDEATTRQRVGQTVADYVPGEEDRRWVEPAILALLGIEQAPAGGRDMLFAAWRIFFERIALRGPVVLVFEDLQWADSGLLDFIDHLLEWSKGVPILVLALARPELLESRPAFGSAARHFNSMPLEPLPEAAMRELLAGLVPGLPDDAVTTIINRADGIPLYAVETIRMLIAEGRLEEADGTYRPIGALGELAIPDTLRSLIASRLDALEQADRALLQRAAVLGQTFTVETLAALTDATAEDLVQRLRALVRREILTVQADPRSPERGQYGFVQGLTREVAYGTLSRRDRRERHLAAARHFEALGVDELAGALASHYLAAYHSSESGAEADAVAAQARLALRGAADRASALGAYAQAAAYLAQALEVAPGAAERADLLERAANALELDAQHGQAIEAARQAIEAYRAAGDSSAAARVTGILGSAMIASGGFTEAATLLVDALASLSDNSPELRADLEVRLSRAHMRNDDSPEAVAAADRALALAEPRAILMVIADALNNKGAALESVGRWREATVLLEGAVRIAEQAGVVELHLRALNNLASVLSGDDPERATKIVEDALELARRLGVRTSYYFLVQHLGAQRYRQGRDWDGVIALTKEARDETRDVADREALTAGLIYYGLARGEAVDDEIAAYESIVGITENKPIMQTRSMLRGEACFARRELDTAYEHYIAAHEYAPGDPFPLEQALRISLWLNDAVRARPVMSAIGAMPNTGRVRTARRFWADAVIASLENRAEEALAGFREARIRYTEIGWLFESARATLDALIALPDAAELRVAADRAREIFASMGARPYVERLEAALAVAQPVG
jgi:class 3 adenylate cyclase/tetratricopeptide (TPR) repeat protein